MDFKLTLSFLSADWLPLLMEQCLENLSNCYQGCEEEISELVYQINKMLSEKKLEWESSYNELLVSNEMLTKDLSTCRLELEDKDAEIADLRKEITIIDRSNYEKRMGLESRICELSHTVSDLKSQLKSNSKFNSSCDDSLELAISALKKECDYYQDKIAELEVAQTTHIAQIKLLEEQRSNILKKNEELKQKFLKCRKEYHSKLNATDCELDVLAKQKNKFESSIKDLKVTLSQKDIEIDNIKGTLEDLLSSNHKNNTLFSNLQKNYDAVSQDKDLLTEKLDSIATKNQELQNQNDILMSKLETMGQNAEQSSYGAKTEVSMLKTQLEIYVKENDFLRTFLLQQDRTGSNSNKHFEYLEKLEADNNSLKENIANMESEIANLLKLSEKNSRAVGTLSSPCEVKQVKERYDRHLENMKAEVEQLTLENLSLKAMHQHCNHSVISGLESNGNSVVISNDGEYECNNRGPYSDEVPALKLPETPSVKSILDSPGKRSLNGKSSSINSPLTKEFKDLQETILKAFEAKLNQCVTNFQTGSQPL